MDSRVRSVLIMGGGAAFVAAIFAAPQVFAAVEPVAKTPSRAAITELFPGDALDPDELVKFDVDVSNAVSTRVVQKDTIRKIGFGVPTTVTVVTTPSGTYSTDALLSPNVRYPGIDVSRKADLGDDWHSTWVVTPRGTIHWTVQNSGSFTFVTISH